MRMFHYSKTHRPLLAVRINAGLWHFYIYLAIQFMVVLRAWKENDWTFFGGGGVCLFVLAINFYIGFSDTAVTSIFFLTQNWISCWRYRRNRQNQAQDQKLKRVRYSLWSFPWPGPVPTLALGVTGISACRMAFSQLCPTSRPMPDAAKAGLW